MWHRHGTQLKQESTTMIRKAILIAGRDPDFDPTKSVREIWRNFLKSNAGGGWFENEIMCPSPSVSDVLAAVKTAEHADYSLVVFIGQGLMVKEDRPWMETRIQLNAKETLLADRQLNTGTPRLALVLDCCRDLSHPISPAHISKISQLETAGADVTFFREVYEANLQCAERGVTKICPASINRRDFENSSFSRLLLDEVFEWCECHDRKTVLSWNDAVAMAQNKMRSNHISEEQKIVYQGGRRLKHFSMALGVSDKTRSINER
jgi:hypothetical protein